MCHGLKPWSSLWMSNSLKPRIKNGRPVSGMLLCDTPHISPDVCKSIKGAVRGQAMTGTHLLKLAKFCITLAMSVSVRDVRSAGYSCIRLNREGDMMAGHMKRRNREELMRLSARSSLPRSAHLALHEAKTSFSSRGNMLRQEHDFIIQCQGEQRDKKKKKKTAARRSSARSGDRNIQKTTGPYTAQRGESVDETSFEIVLHHVDDITNYITGKKTAQ